MSGSLEIREATLSDEPAILALLAASLGRELADARYGELYRWKHHENAFGPSPAWVAVDGERVAGVRVLMRWEFISGEGVVRAVRAVDTATHPDYQGRGIFTQLTTHALAALGDERVDFVFNTPNDQSRPGYLKMGWQVVGRLPVAARPAGLRGALRMATARVPADRWSERSVAGDPAGAVLADDAEVESLLASISVPPVALTTARSAAFLRWRYGSPLLGYRAVVAPGGVSNGLVVLRERRRGPAREAVVCEVLVPDGARRARGRLVREALRAVEADYAIAIARGGGAWRDGFVPLPRQGPVLTWRSVRHPGLPAPERSRWRLGLGDVELF